MKRMDLLALREAINNHLHMQVTDMYEVDEGFVACLRNMGYEQENFDGSHYVIHDPIIRVWIEEGNVKVVLFDDDDQPGGDIGEPHVIAASSDKIQELVFGVILRDLILRNQDQTEEEKKKHEQKMSFNLGYRTKLRGFLKKEETNRHDTGSRSRM